MTNNRGIWKSGRANWESIRAPLPRRRSMICCPAQPTTSRVLPDWFSKKTANFIGGLADAIPDVRGDQQRGKHQSLSRRRGEGGGQQGAAPAAIPDQSADT